MRTGYPPEIELRLVTHRHERVADNSVRERIAERGGSGMISPD